MNRTEKYKDSYLPGFDCRLATFRNNLAYYDIRLSNGMTLGLSGALMFLYCPPEDNSLDLSFAVGVSDQTLESLASNFSAHIWFKKFSFDDEEIFSEIRDNLNMGFLINALINRPYLAHLRSKKNEEFKIEPYNIGHHYLTITDIDESNNVTVFETDDGNPFILSPQELKDVWFFDRQFKRDIVDTFLKCDGYYYYYSQPKINAHKNIRFLLCAIEKVVELFFQDIDPNMGVLGLKRFFRDAMEWKNQSEKLHKIIHSLVMIKINESLLSGGGFGRRLYSYFLSEVADIINNKDLKSIAGQFKETALLWKRFVLKVTNGGVYFNPKQTDLNEINIILEEYAPKIIEAEFNQMKALQNWLKEH